MCSHELMHSVDTISFECSTEKLKTKQLFLVKDLIYKKKVQWNLSSFLGKTKQTLISDGIL